MANKKFVVFFSLLSFSTCNFLPVYSNELQNEPLRPITEQATTEQLATEPTAAAKATPDQTISTPSTTSTPKPSEDATATTPVHHRCLLGKTGKFTVGVITKTPFAIVRKSKEETVSDTKELIGDKTNHVLVGAAGALSLPFGITSGLFEGVSSTVVDSWKHCSN
jgi:hypothetical protein